MYAVGYHPSLLPRYRGCNAVKWTVCFGDTVAGGTVYELDEKVDGGADRFCCPATTFRLFPAAARKIFLDNRGGMTYTMPYAAKARNQRFPLGGEQRR